jgi:hypothetical protein
VLGGKYSVVSIMGRGGNSVTYKVAESAAMHASMQNHQR